MRWGYTSRSSAGLADRGMSVSADDLGPIRHAWDGRPRVSKRHPIHAICRTRLAGLGPRDERFDPAHPRTCPRCLEQADLLGRLA